MSETTAVPSPTFGDNGFIVPTEAAILAGAISDIVAALGGGANPALSTPQGQIASSLTAIIGDCNDNYLQLTNLVDPKYSSGRMQDGIARIYFLSRLPALSTTLQVACIGLPGVVISTDSLIYDQNNNIYFCTTTGIIPQSGTITLPFACTVTGPLPVPSGSNVYIYQQIAGWDSVTCVSGVIGRNVETAAAFELRRQQSVALNSIGTNGAILGSVLAVPGVVDAYVVDNPLSTPQNIGTVTLLPNSIYACAAGSFAPAAVAFAVWLKKPPGCNYTGNTTETVTDPNPLYVSSAPTYSVSFETAINTPIFFAVTLKNSATVPTTALTSIQTAIQNAFSGADGGIVPRIGSEIFASRFYAGIASLGPWSQIVNVLIGCGNNPSSTFTGSISGTTLTVSAVISGALAIGQYIADGSDSIVSGTKLIAGSGTTWTVSTSQAVASETMYTVVASLNDVSMMINQEPTFAAANVTLTLA
jgi:hypothetical protein